MNANCTKRLEERYGNHCTKVQSKYNHYSKRYGHLQHIFLTAHTSITAKKILPEFHTLSHGNLLRKHQSNVMKIESDICY